MTPRPSIEIPAQEILLQKYKVQRTNGKALTTRSSNIIYTDAGFLKTVHVGQYFMTKDTQIQWPVVSTHCQEMKTRKHQDWTRIGSHNQLPTR